MKHKLLKLTCLTLISTLHLPLPAAALDTAFTYQGRLNDGAGPANGAYSLRFSVFDAATGGSAVAGPVTNATTAVSNGLFTVALDFGAGVFDGNPRWVEIGVRANGSTGDFATLSPRQSITPAPYALYAPNAAYALGANTASLAYSVVPGAVSQLGAPDGTPSNALQVDPNGLVGIGTNAPQAGLQITTGASEAMPTLLSQMLGASQAYPNLHDAIASLDLKGGLLAAGSYYGYGFSAVTLLDLTNPAMPRMLWTVTNGTAPYTNLGIVKGVALSSNLLAVASQGSNAVTLVDISSPTAPVFRACLRDGVGGFTNLGGPAAVAISGNLLIIVAWGDSAITFVDISNPAAPQLRASIKDGDPGFTDLWGASHLALRGNLLAVSALGDNAVTLIDISNPAAPAWRSTIKNGVGSFTNLAGAEAMAISGNLLAIASPANNAVTLVDVSNPSAPVWRGAIRNGEGGFSQLRYPIALCFVENTLWIAAHYSSALTLADVSNPAAPLLKLELSDGVSIHLQYPFSLAADGGTVAAGAAPGVSVFDALATQSVGLASAGWVGIGTSKPLAPLHVVGDVLVEGASRARLNAENVELGNSTAEGYYATALGMSTASGSLSVAGGSSIASGQFSTAFGSAIARGFVATALGDGTANGDWSLAAGSGARADHKGAFVWADSQSGDFASTADNQFLIRAAGGVGIGTRAPASALDVNGTVTATSFSGNGAGLTNLVNAPTYTAGNGLALNGNAFSLRLGSTVTNDTMSSVGLRIVTPSTIYANPVGLWGAAGTAGQFGPGIACGVFGESPNGAGVFGITGSGPGGYGGVYGVGYSGASGVFGYSDSGIGVSGRSALGGTAVYGENTSASGFAGRFLGNVSVSGSLSLTDKDLLLHGDAFHGLGWYGASRLFAGASVNGPVLYGWSGGALGSTGSGTNIALSWDASRNVSIGNNLSVGNSLTMYGPARLWDKILYLRGGTDLNHGVGWYGSGTFAGSNPDGPVLFGCGGGALGTACGSQVIALAWNSSGNVGIGTTAPTARLSVNGAANNTTGVWGIFSDRRLKENVEPMAPGSLDRLLQLQGVTYQYNKPELTSGYDGVHRGWIAQDVAKIFPEWVSEAPDGMKMVTPVGINALTVEALRELRAEKDAQLKARDSEIAELKQTVNELKELVGKLTQKVDGGGR